MNNEPLSHNVGDMLWKSIIDALKLAIWTTLTGYFPVPWKYQILNRNKLCIENRIITDPDLYKSI